MSKEKCFESEIYCEGNFYQVTTMINNFIGSSSNVLHRFAWNNFLEMNFSLFIYFYIIIQDVRQNDSMHCVATTFHCMQIN